MYLQKYWLRYLNLRYENLYLNFRKVSKLCKGKRLRRNDAFLFLFPLALDSFKSNWWQNLKHAVVLNYYETIDIKRNISSDKQNSPKGKKVVYLALSYLLDILY